MAKGWLDNYNDSKTSAPEGMEGDGFSNVGRNSSPAWGGQFQMGGVMPGAVGHMYTRTGDIPSKGPKRNKFYKTDASAQGGTKLNPHSYDEPDYSLRLNPFLSRDPEYNMFIGGASPSYSNKDFSIGAHVVGVGNEDFRQLPADYGIRGSYNPSENLSVNARLSKNNVGAGMTYRFENGGEIAQNGQEMQYYQQGLDWKPKSISKNGGWLDSYDVAQEGINLPSVRDLITDTMNRKIQERKGKGKETKVTQKDNAKIITPKVDTTKPLTKEQVDARRLLEGLKQNIATDEETSLQERKNQAFKSMQEFYKSPLGSPGYFTPEGAIIGALQGATKLGPDLYEGNYKGAAIDALMALPIGIPAAKGLGRVLGPEEGLMGKVSQEININRNLGKIKKEGQLQGLSDYEIAKKQMEKVGITSNQRKGYTPIVSELAEKYITPQGYVGYDGNSKLSQIIKNIKQGGVDYTMIRPERIDAWKLYLGRPQVSKTFSLSDTAPALHPSYKPGSLKGMDIYNIESKKVLKDIEPNVDDFFHEKERLALLDNPISVSREPAIMGGYNKVMTKQGTQYNDIWDLDAPMSFRSLVPNKISENSLLENIFYKTNAQGVQSPRGVAVPVSKVFGKPFMSHGNLPYTSTEYVNALRNELSEKLTRFEKSIGPNEIRPVPTEERWLQQLKNLESYPKFKQGGIIKDDRGQWDHPGEITEIGSNEITMEGVPYDVLGVSDTGDTKLMKPEKNYKFKGKKVTEYPMAKNGLRQEQKGLQNLDNLTNFTNYNKPQPGGWLEAYK